MTEAPGSKTGEQASCVRPEVHAPLAALLSALSTFNGTSDAPMGPTVALGGENRGKSAFAPIPSQSSQNATSLTGAPSPFELPLHLRMALAQMGNQAAPHSAQDTSSTCQLAAMGSRPINIPTSKVDPEDFMDGDDDDQDTSSNQAVTTASPTAGTPLSAEAKRKRRQEINRESARRVRKRKSEAHKKLQEEVTTLKNSLAAITADQSVIVRYASELFKERETILRRATELESKWVTAECQLVVLRQQVTDLQSKLSQSGETG